MDQTHRAGVVKMAEVTKVDEKEDGSAEVTLELTSDEVQILINYALQKAVENLIIEALRD